MDNFIPPPIKITNKEDQGEDRKDQNNGRNTKEEEDRKEDKDKTQADDSGWEVDEKNYSDFADSDFIY